MMTSQQKEKIVDLLQLYQCFGIKYIEPLNFRKENIKINNMLPNSYEKLYEYIHHCNLCELSKSCQKNIGTNNPNSDIYIIGDNYSFDDPNLVSQVRFFFEKVLGLDFNQLYMTNIIKCETNRGGFSYDEAASQCKEYIFQEIIIGKPKYIFATLSACKYILKNQVIDNSFVGNSYRVDESIVFPIFDFDFIAKNPSYQEEMLRVFKKIKGMIS